MAGRKKHNQPARPEQSLLAPRACQSRPLLPTARHGRSYLSGLSSVSSQCSSDHITALVENPQWLPTALRTKKNSSGVHS